MDLCFWLELFVDNLKEKERASHTFSTNGFLVLFSLCCVCVCVFLLLVLRVLFFPRLWVCVRDSWKRTIRDPVPSITCNDLYCCYYCASNQGRRRLRRRGQDKRQQTTTARSSSRSLKQSDKNVSRIGRLLFPGGDWDDLPDARISQPTKRHLLELHQSHVSRQTCFTLFFLFVRVCLCFSIQHFREPNGGSCLLLFKCGLAKTWIEHCLLVTCALITGRPREGLMYL